MFFLLVCVVQFLRSCRMSTIYEPSYLLRERAAFQPEIRLTANGGALSPIQLESLVFSRYSMTTYIANKYA